MRRLFLFSGFLFLLAVSAAQTSAGIISELKAVNQQVSARPCNADSAAAISHRAMNVFLADKTAYLAGSSELSFFTNYVALNSSESKVSVNHNFQQYNGGDNPVKGLWSVGFDMTIANAYSKGMLDNRFENGLGMSFGYKWIAKVKTSFADCNAMSGQKVKMDILRMVLLSSLQTDIEKNDKEFQVLLDSVSANIPAGQADSAKALAARYHFAALKDSYEERFATQQAALLTQTGNYKRISTGWTSITAYVPIITAKYYVAGSFSTNFQNHHPYAFNFLLSHTRLWESRKNGRLFVTASGNVLFNNSKLAYSLNKLNYSEYISLGGGSNPSAIDPGNSKLYIGNYKTFITLSGSMRAVYFPYDSHVGISILAEQHIGIFNPLDVKLGIPIVLVNHHKTPAVNIECYLLVFDIGKTNSRLNNTGKTMLGISAGIPFSRLMY